MAAKQIGRWAAQGLFVACSLPSLLLAAVAPLIKAPEGWEILNPQTLPPDLTFLARSPPKNMFSSTINIAFEETPLSLEEYLQEVAKIYQDPGKIFYSLGVIETNEGTMKVVQIDEKLPWADLRILQGIIIKNHTAYVITATTEEAEFATLLPTLLTTMKSFTLPSTPGVLKP